MENHAQEIKLTLDPFDRKAIETASRAADKPTLEGTDESAFAKLTSEEKAMVNDFAAMIDVTDQATILQYGAGTQQKIADFSDNALKSVRSQDLGEVGDMIAALVGELKAFNDETDEKGLSGLFRRGKRKITVLKSKYDKAENSVNNIISVLENHQITLLKDIALLDRLYETNLAYFKELSMYILAGKKKLGEERATTLASLQNRARESGLPEDAQRANDFSTSCDRFEKKIHDLELTRMVSIQMAPQIRLVQGNDSLMSEKIQSTIVNTIPLWKSQMIIALGLAHSEQALRAERAVTDMTNDLLKKNAAILHQSTVEIARESERGVVDIETLTQTNQELIQTLDEVQQVRLEGREKRRAAEAELVRIEEELKTKLLEMRK